MLPSVVVPTKPWYLSKTIWLAVIAILIQFVPILIPALAQMVSPEAMIQIKAVSEMIVGFLLIINRVIQPDTTPPSPNIG